MTTQDSASRRRSCRTDRTRSIRQGRGAMPIAPTGGHEWSRHSSNGPSMWWPANPSLAAWASRPERAALVGEGFGSTLSTFGGGVTTLSRRTETEPRPRSSAVHRAWISERYDEELLLCRIPIDDRTVIPNSKLVGFDHRQARERVFRVLRNRLQLRRDSISGALDSFLALVTVAPVPLTRSRQKAESRPFPGYPHDFRILSALRRSAFCSSA